LGEDAALGRYDRYILTQLIALFGFFSLVLISVYWVNEAVDLFDSLISDGQTLPVFLEFGALTLPQTMLLVLPVSAFVATLYRFNRLIGESELVVLQTSGFSAVRLLRPVLWFGLLTGILVLLLGHVLAPAAQAQLRDRSLEVRDDPTGKLLREGQFIHPTAGLTVYIGEITETGAFHNLFFQDRTDPRAEISYTAPRALLVRAETGPRLVMFQGTAQTLDAETGRLSIIRFKDFTYDIGAAMRNQGLRRLDIRELPTRDLIAADADMADAMGLSLAQMRFAGHERIARALFAVFPPIIAAAMLMLGGFSRFGAWPQILAAVCVVIPFQATWNLIETSAIRDADLAHLAYAQPLAAASTAAAVAALAMRDRGRPGRRRAPA